MDDRHAMRPHLDNAGTGLQGPRQLIAVASVLAAMVLVVLDAAIANVALPTIARSLQVTPAMSIWIITAYQSALVMALLPCAALGESFGFRKVFTVGVALFVGASVLCAVSPSLPWLVAARFLQGLGGAAVMALGVALLRAVVPDRRLGAAIGWNALAVALSSAAGPTIGAAILSGASWPWLFAVNLPLGMLVLLASRALPHVTGTARRLDLFSVALNAGAFASLVIGAELLPARPVLAAALLAAAAIALTALVRREWPKEVPLIPLDLLSAHSFRISVSASVLCFTGVAAGLVALPFYLQHKLGQSIWMTGLYMTPWPLTVAVAAPIAGRLANHVSTAWLCAVGGACLAIGLTGAAMWPLQGNLLPLVLLTMLCGLGFGLFQVPNNHNMFLSAPRERSGAAGGMQGTARLTGQTAGAILMTLLFTLASIDAAPRIGLGIAAVLALAAGLVSVLRARPNATSPHGTIPRITPSRHRSVVGMALASAVFVGGAQTADAQTAPEHKPGFEFLVSTGSLIPVGTQRDAIKRGDLTAAQLAWVARPIVAITATVGWARSRDNASTDRPKLDVFTYDLGVEARANDWTKRGAVTFSPFVGSGAGGRSYNYRSMSAEATHNLSAYGSVGAEIGYRRVRLRIEARDYLTGFKPLVAEGTAGQRNDIIVMAGVRIVGRKKLAE